VSNCFSRALGDRPFIEWINQKPVSAVCRWMSDGATVLAWPTSGSPQAAASKRVRTEGFGQGGLMGNPPEVGNLPINAWNVVEVCDAWESAPGH